MSEALHVDRYRHNKEFLYSGIKDKDTYIDWCITVMFYSGLHLIEAMLERQGLRAKNHTERKNQMQSLSNYSALREPYTILYQKSVEARYGCFKMDNADYCETEAQLIELEKEFKKY